MRATLPRHTVLLRQKKGWMNADVMCWLAHAVQASLLAWRATHDIIFTSDAYKAHFTPRVLRAFAARRIMFHLIPAKATWIMQPADTHLFAMYKAHMAKVCQQKMLSRSEQSLCWQSLVEGVVDTIEQIIHGRHWAPAFAHVGLVGNQDSVSARVCHKLGIVEPMKPGVALPSLDQLTSIFPRNSSVQVGDLFAYFTTRPVSRPPRPPIGESPSVVVHAVSGANPWYGRLRSSSALGRAEQEVEDPPPLPPPPCRPPSTPVVMLGARTYVLRTARRMLPAATMPVQRLAAPPLPQVEEMERDPTARSSLE